MVESLHILSKYIDIIVSISYTYIMNPIHLAAFQAVAETGSFARAADRLFVSQPAVSLHVASLEAELGIRLFDRLPRGSELTDAGHLLLSYVERIDTIESEARSAIDELARGSRGRLAIGASTTIGVYLLPLVLGQYKSVYPQIEPTLLIENTESICTHLADGVIELGMTEGEEIAPVFGLDSSVFFEDELVVIAAPGHPLASKKRVTARMLAGERFLERESGSGTRAVAERAFREAGIERQIEMVFGHTEAIKRGVIGNLGIAVVSQLTVRYEHEAGQLAVIRPAGLRLNRPFRLVTRQGRSLSHAASYFVQMLTGKTGGQDALIDIGE